MSSSFGAAIMDGTGGVTGLYVRVSADSASRLTPNDDPFAARDGCINYPGRAHNSADCSLITAWDPSWEVPNKPLNRMTGAEENMLRSYNLLHAKPYQFRP